MQEKKRIHIIGIKGWGTSALAQLLAAQGNTVCGSDHPTYYRSQEPLENNPLITLEDFSDSIHNNLDEVVYSTAYINHPQLSDTLAKGIPTFSYPERLAPLFNESYGIAVSGTHGKTTTSSWIAYVLRELGYDPSALIGSQVKQFSTNVLVGSSPYFVLEADEYQRKLDKYDPTIAVITSIEYDHPDFFKNKEEYIDVFQKFAQKVLRSGTVVVCWEENGVREALKLFQSPGLITYGFDQSYDYCARDIRNEKYGHSFEVLVHKKSLGRCSIKLFGLHNVLNALAVIAVTKSFAQGNSKKLFEIIYSFEGTARRFEMRNPIGETVIIDDYGHHPTEVAVTLRAIREKYPDKKIWCVFWPHTYSRTEKLFNDFVQCFDNVDKAVIIDIYGSVREQLGTVTSQQLVDAMNQRTPLHAYASGSSSKTAEFIKEHLGEIDVLVTMGAEDVWKDWETIMQVHT